ncbi:hypothetical protein ACNKHL_13675 [Shigella flexneri]
MRIFEQPFFQMEAQLAGFNVGLNSASSDTGYLLTSGVASNFVQRFATQFRFLRQQLFRPYFFSFEAAGELD